MSVAWAKANRGLQLDLSANLGLSQSAGTFREVYMNPKDREIVGLSLQVPIYDWGMSRGRVKMAQAEERLIRTEVEQETVDFQQDISIKVMQFNNQTKQCEISRKAREVADERYELSKKRFQNGAITVSDLNTVLKEKDEALMQYINQLKIFWNAYYVLQIIALYDFISKKDISTEFDKLIK